MGRVVPAVMIVVSLLLVGVNLLVISPVATGAVQDLVDEAVVWTAEDWEDPDWLLEKSERSYSAWNLTNAAALEAGVDTEMRFEEVGPFIYEITTEREVIMHDADAGTLTYKEVSSFEWISGQPGTDEITNVNILWNPQRIGATGLAIDGGTSFAKGGFTAGMLRNDLANMVPGAATADAISSDVDDAVAMLSDQSMGEIYVSAAWYGAWNGSNQTGLLYQSTLDSSGDPTLDTWTSPDFTSISHHLLYDAADPTDSSICIALTCDLGPVLVAGMGAPEASITDAIAAGADSTTIARASLLGYLAMNGQEPDYPETWARDWAVYSAVATMFAAAGGGVDLETLDSAVLSARLEAVSGATISDDKIDNLLFGYEDGDPVGLLVGEELSWGVVNFLLGALDNPFQVALDYGIGLSDLQDLGDWAGDWFLATTEFPLVLSGGSGTINSDDWLLQSFGSNDPITGDYIYASLNIGGLWNIMYGQPPVDLTQQQSENILYGPHGLTGDFALQFLYGEFAGISTPMDENMTAVMGGTVHVWDDDFVASLYDIDVNSARALRWFVRELVFNQTIGDMLSSLFGATPYLTQPVNNWLFGWRDELVAQLSGDADDPDLGWVSLESNKTYYGSNDVSTDSESIITIYTGETNLAKTGHRIAEDGSQYLPWRGLDDQEETYGLLEPVIQAGTVGGRLDPNEGGLVNLGGYAVAHTEYMGDSEVNGIPTKSHSISLDPAENPIQAKLIGSDSLLDVFPGALPIYFGGQADLKVEPTTGMAMSGVTGFYFYLDTRGVGAVNPSSEDLVPVFLIESSAEIDPDDAETFKDKVLHNSEPMTYWTNFDTDAGSFYIDQITLVIYLIAAILLGFGALKLSKSEAEEEIAFSAEEE